MAAGVVDLFWAVADIVPLVEAAEPRPGKRRPYKAKEHMPHDQTVNPTSEYDVRIERMRLTFSYIVLGGVGVACGLILFGLLALILWSEHRGRLVDYIFAQPGAVIGVPFCAAMSVFVVLLLRSTQGPVDFELLGLRFRGGSGPIVMWVLCFMSFVGATKLLWVH